MVTFKGSEENDANDSMSLAVSDADCSVERPDSLPPQNSGGAWPSVDGELIRILTKENSGWSGHPQKRMND